MRKGKRFPLFRTVIPTAVLIGLLWAGRGMAVPAQAEEYVFSAEESGTAEIGAAWDWFRGELDGEAEEAAEGIDPSDPRAAAEKLSEALSPEKLRQMLRRALLKGLDAVIPAAAPVFGLLLLAAAAKSMEVQKKTKDGFERVLRLAAAVVIFRLCGGMLELARNVTGTVCRIAEALVPMAEGVCLIGGGVTEGRIVRVGILLLLTVAGEITGRLLIPAAGALMGLNALSGGTGFAGAIAGGIRKALLRIWQFFTVGLSFLLGAQTVLGRAADSLGQRWMKLAVSSFVPVAGGVISDAWGVLTGSVRALRGVIGIGGILILFAVVLTPAVRLLLWQWTFGLGKTAAESIGCPELASLFESARGTAELLAAFSLCTLFLFVLQLAVFAGIGR